MSKDIQNDDHDIPQPSEPRVGFSQQVEDMRKWGEENFGSVKPSVLIERAQKEMKELIDKTGDEWTPEIAEEAADVFLVLTRVPGLAEAILQKHAINLQRKWDIRPDGTAYHLPESTTSVDKVEQTIAAEIEVPDIATLHTREIPAKDVPIESLVDAMIESIAVSVENLPPFQALPDHVIPAHEERDDFGELTGFHVPEARRKRRRLTNKKDIARVIRETKFQPGENRLYDRLALIPVYTLALLEHFTEDGLHRVRFDLPLASQQCVVKKLREILGVKTSCPPPFSSTSPTQK